MLDYIEEGEPLKLSLPDRRVSTYVQSHFYLDEFPQSTEPLDENPRPHTQLGAQLDDYVSADDGYQGRPFPQVRRPSFLGPGPDTDSEGADEAFRRDGFDAPRPPPAAPSSSVSGRLGEAALRGGEAIIAADAAGVGQAVERFGFRNAERAAAQVEQRVLPRIIGRPADAEQLIIRAGQRAQEVERAAAADIEQFATEPQKAASWCPCWRRRALRRRPQRRREAASWKGWRRRAEQPQRARQQQQPFRSPKGWAWRQAWPREARQLSQAAPLTACIEAVAGCCRATAGIPGR